jgi:two-component system, chemotaxis family, chemotaxis protein CheY
MKIMIIDDSSVMRRIHKNTLLPHLSNGSVFVEAEDGLEALEMAKKEKVDLFLVDWNMPKINGLDFIKRLRNMNFYKETPMIMITSEAARYNVIEAINGGVTDYIVKPIKGELLWNKIEKYVKEVVQIES